MLCSPVLFSFCLVVRYDYYWTNNTKKIHCHKFIYIQLYKQDLHMFGHTEHGNIVKRTFLPLSHFHPLLTWMYYSIIFGILTRTTNIHTQHTQTHTWLKEGVKYYIIVLFDIIYIAMCARQHNLLYY